MRIAQEVIEDIRSKSDIVEVISHYLPIVVKGRAHKAVCPFHDDHDPSMSISSEKQIFRCFTCGASGNAFSFVQRYENISFVEAVAKVAEIANVEIQFNPKAFQAPIDPKKVMLQKICEEVSNYCHFNLESEQSIQIKKYLLQRGMNDKILKQFQIGYHPKGNKIYEFLHAKKYVDEDIVNANIAWISENGLQDVFSHRIMIPIHDEQGNAIGFTARRVDETQNAKYINTSDTPIYHKSDIVFNYHRAKQVAKREGKLFVVEGAMDVISFAKIEMDNCVATLGTSCTNHQMRKLKQLNVKIIVCYDGDKAGQNATYKFIKLAHSMNVEVEIVNNTYGLDPDEIIEKYGVQEFVAICNKTVGWIHFLMNHLKSQYDLHNHSEKLAYAKEISEEIQNVKDSFEQNVYYDMLQQITGINARQKATNFHKKPSNTVPVLKRPNSKRVNAQIQIIRQIIQNKSGCAYYRDELGFLLDEEYNSLALYIIDYYRNHDVIVVSSLYDVIEEEHLKQLLLQSVDVNEEADVYHEVVLKEAMDKIKQCLVEDKIQALKIRSEQVHDPIKKGELAKEISVLRRQLGEV